MKLGRDEVLMATHMGKVVSAISAQGRIQGRVKQESQGALIAHLSVNTISTSIIS